MTHVSNVTRGQILSALSVGRFKRPTGSPKYVRRARSFFINLILVVRHGAGSGFRNGCNHIDQREPRGPLRVNWLITQNYLFIRASDVFRRTEPATRRATAAPRCPEHGDFARAPSQHRLSGRCRHGNLDRGGADDGTNRWLTP